jgi:hypothetical protein
MDEIGKSLGLLVRVQGDIKRCREAADRISGRKYAAKLNHMADEMEQAVRELDRLVAGAPSGNRRIGPCATPKPFVVVALLSTNAIADDKLPNDVTDDQMA